MAAKKKKKKNNRPLRIAIAVSKTKKILNMLADDTAAPAAARTLAKAQSRKGS